VIKFILLLINWTGIERSELDSEDDVAEVWSVMKMTAAARNKEMKSEK
jgi:hypothetical protein